MLDIPPMRTSWHVALLVPALALAGCAVDAGTDPSVATDDSAVVSGPLDWSRPAVGTLGACSATLIAEGAVVTSSGCHGDAFEVRDARGEIAGSYPLGAERRVGDLLVVSLGTPVPAAVATPLPLASDVPAEGARVTMLGFGCTGQRVEDVRKRSAAVRWSGAPRATCPGTLFVDEAGRAVAVSAALVPPALEGLRSAL